MIKFVNHVYALNRPSATGLELPIVFDSPHSGTVYPTNTGIVAPAMALKSTWDAYVDELWSVVPAVGAALLSARFPRAYIDANRSPTDIDQELLREPWPTPLLPSDACKRGMGLIRRYALPNVPMYAEPLRCAEVSQRIYQYYDPYHQVLQMLIDQGHARFGEVWHIDCHSMKSIGNAMNADSGGARPDFVVSDYNGTTANPSFTEWTVDKLRQLGYVVSVNAPYQGGHIVRKYGAPAQRKNSIQIEINRRLYMNESTFERNDGFEHLQLNLGVFASDLAEYVRSLIKLPGH